MWGATRARHVILSHSVVPLRPAKLYSLFRGTFQSLNEKSRYRFPDLEIPRPYSYTATSLAAALVARNGDLATVRIRLRDDCATPVFAAPAGSPSNRIRVIWKLRNARTATAKRPPPRPGFTRGAGNKHGFRSQLSNGQVGVYRYAVALKFDSLW
jgi:hypothetical protein